MKDKLCSQFFLEKYDVIGDLTDDLTKCKLHKNFMRKMKGKKMWIGGIEPTTSLIDKRVRIKINEKHKYEKWGVNPQPLQWMRELGVK